VCDWDHRHSTIACSLPPVSKAIAVGIEKVSGGHRQRTHSLLGASAFVVLAAMAAQTSSTHPWAGSRLGPGLLCMFMINLAAKALKLFPKSGWIAKRVFALAVAGLVTWFAPRQWGWLPLSILWVT
jgi:membrane-bound metal-dependent hydrolase YbcI (DUF457 family)